MDTVALMSDPQNAAEPSTLEKWVRARGVRIVQVATDLGVGRLALHRYMAGRVMPRPETIRTIERVSEGAVTSADLVRDHRGAAAK